MLLSFVYGKASVGNDGQPLTIEFHLQEGGLPGSLHATQTFGRTSAMNCVMLAQPTNACEMEVDSPLDEARQPIGPHQALPVHGPKKRLVDYTKERGPGVLHTNSGVPLKVSRNETKDHHDGLLASPYSKQEGGPSVTKRRLLRQLSREYSPKRLLPEVSPECLSYASTPPGTFSFSSSCSSLGTTSDDDGTGDGTTAASESENIEFLFKVPRQGRQRRRRSSSLSKSRLEQLKEELAAIHARGTFKSRSFRRMTTRQPSFVSRMAERALQEPNGTQDTNEESIAAA